MFFIEHIAGTSWVVLVWRLNGIERDEPLPSHAANLLPLREGERRQLTFGEFRSLLAHTDRLQTEYYQWLADIRASNSKSPTPTYTYP